MRNRLVVLALALASCAAAAAAVGASAIDPFYTQQSSARGIPIIASPKVSPEALVAARAMAQGMTAHRPDLARVLADTGYRIAIMAQDEALLDLPELRHWRKPEPDDVRLTRCEIKHYDVRIGRLSDRDYWNARARGTGGQHMVAAEEDVLGLRPNRYFGETIFVHEFAHQILAAIRASDVPLYRRIEAAYADARHAGLWRDEYTMTTLDEYWAEGTQFWFDDNRLQAFDGRRILDHQDVAAYDPRLYALLGAVYGDRHKLDRDPFWKHPARVPAGPVPRNTAEVC